MPRTPRRIEPGAVYHLISRFVDREWFITSDLERRQYLTLLGKAVIKSDWRCISFAVMSNHIHLGTVAGTQPLDSWIRRIHAPFADWMNRTHGRIGVMFVRGPKALPVAPEGVGSLIAYIHNNPVRAGVASAPTETDWTSHRYYAGLASPPAWLDVRDGLARAGFADRNLFDRWVSDPEREEYAPADGVDDDRSDEGADVECGNARPAIWRPDPASLVRVTADELGLSVAQLCSRGRGRAQITARQVAVFCAEAVGVGGTELARALSLSQQGISYIRNREPRDEVPELGARVLKRLRDMVAPELKQPVPEP
jgi:hypothetical protein